MHFIPQRMMSSNPASGYEDQLFLDLPPKSLQCPICLLVLREPYLLSCCGGHACKVSE